MDLMKDVMELWIEMFVKISECNLGFSCGIIPKCIHKDKAKPVLLYVFSWLRFLKKNNAIKLFNVAY